MSLSQGASQIIKEQTASRRWKLTIARVIGVVFILVAEGMFFASLPSYYSQLLKACAGSDCVANQLSPGATQVLESLGYSLSFYAAYWTSILVAAELLFLVVAGVILWRRSNELMAIYLSVTLVVFGVGFSPSTGALSETFPAWEVTADLMKTFGFLLLFHLFYIFPDGRFVPRWTRFMPFFWIAAIIALTLASPDESLNQTIKDVLFQTVIVTGFVLGSWTQIYRYMKVSEPLHRQQTKLAVFGLVLMALGIVTGLLLSEFVAFGTGDEADLAFNVVGAAVFFAGSAVLFPISVGIAILRYRLWDVDFIINRTLSYGLLTVILAGGYVGLVLLIQLAFRAIAGEASTIAIVISTLVIAALLNPMRRHVQRMIDQRFFRHRYDAAQALAAFGARVRDEVDLNALSSEMIGVAKETMQPAHVSLWLRDSQGNSASSPR